MEIVPWEGYGTLGFQVRPRLVEQFLCDNFYLLA